VRNPYQRGIADGLYVALVQQGFNFFECFGYFKSLVVLGRYFPVFSPRGSLGFNYRYVVNHDGQALRPRGVQGNGTELGQVPAVVQALAVKDVECHGLSLIVAKLGQSTVQFNLSA
jgi:hypothetical protein